MKIKHKIMSLKESIAAAALLFISLQTWAELSQPLYLKAKSFNASSTKVDQNLGQQCTKNDKLFCLGDNVTYLIHPPNTGANRPVKLIKIDGDFPNEKFTILDTSAKFSQATREDLCPQNRICVNDEVIGLVRKIQIYDPPNPIRWVTGVVTSIQSNGVFKILIQRNVLSQSNIQENDSVALLASDIYKAVLCGEGNKCAFSSNENYQYGGNPAVITRVYENGFSIIQQPNSEKSWQFVYTKDIGLLKDAFVVPDIQSRLANLKTQTEKERADYFNLLREANRLLDLQTVYYANSLLTQEKANNAEARTISKRSAAIVNRSEQKDREIEWAQDRLEEQKINARQQLERLEIRKQDALEKAEKRRQL